MAGLTKVQRGCRRALKDYLGLEDYETLLIVTNEQRRSMAYALQEAALRITENVMVLEAPEIQPGEKEPLPGVAKAMRFADAVVLATTQPYINTKAREEATELGVRIATLPNISDDALIRCFSADLDELEDLTTSLAEVLGEVGLIRITTQEGTDINFPYRRKRVKHETGILRTISDFGNLASGIASFIPVERKPDGMIVIDGTTSFSGPISSYINIKMENGIIKEVDGGLDAEELQALMKEAGRGGKQLIEVGIGTNDKAILSGEMYEDERAAGNLRFSIGKSTLVSGKAEITHIADVVLQKPTVYLEDAIIIEDGEFRI